MRKKDVLERKRRSNIRVRIEKRRRRIMVNDGGVLGRRKYGEPIYMETEELLQVRLQPANEGD